MRRTKIGVIPFWRYGYIDDFGIEHVVVTSKDPPPFPTTEGTIPTQASQIIRNLISNHSIFVWPPLTETYGT